MTSTGISIILLSLDNVPTAHHGMWIAMILVGIRLIISNASPYRGYSLELELELIYLIAINNNKYYQILGYLFKDVDF